MAFQKVVTEWRREKVAAQLMRRLIAVRRTQERDNETTFGSWSLEKKPHQISVWCHRQVSYCFLRSNLQTSMRWLLTGLAALLLVTATLGENIATLSPLGEGPGPTDATPPTDDPTIIKVKAVPVVRFRQPVNIGQVLPDGLPIVVASDSMAPQPPPSQEQVISSIRDPDPSNGDMQVEEVVEEELAVVDTTKIPVMHPMGDGSVLVQNEPVSVIRSIEDPLFREAPVGAADTGSAQAATPKQDPNTLKKPQEGDKTLMVILIVCAVLLVAGLVALVILLMKKRRKRLADAEAPVPIVAVNDTTGTGTTGTSTGTTPLPVA